MLGEAGEQQQAHHAAADDERVVAELGSRGAEAGDDALHRLEDRVLERDVIGHADEHRVLSLRVGREGRAEQPGDAVAGLPVGDLGADLDDDAGRLVADRSRQRRRPLASVEAGLPGADAAGRDLHRDVVRAKLERAVDDLDLLRLDDLRDSGLESLAHRAWRGIYHSIPGGHRCRPSSPSMISSCSRIWRARFLSAA